MFQSRSVGLAAGLFSFVLLSSGVGADDGRAWLDGKFSSGPGQPSKLGASSLARAAGAAASGLDRDPGISTSGGCIPASLRAALGELSDQFGSVKITSTCRSRTSNARAGGAPQSLHLSGQAVDFRVSGSPKAVLSALASNGNVGGFKHYGGGLYHIDTGARGRF